MKYHIYILYSEKSDKYYVGPTQDVQRRLHDHNFGERPNQKTKYTFKHRPWVLKASFEVGGGKSNALKVERYIKRQKSRVFIEQLIKAKDDPTSLAQLIRIPI